jgi:hypothetical protein
MEHTLELSDDLEINESLERSGNNINMDLNETATMTEEINSRYFIRRAGDLAFIRTNFP